MGVRKNSTTECRLFIAIYPTSIHKLTLEIQVLETQSSQVKM